VLLCSLCMYEPEPGPPAPVKGPQEQEKPETLKSNLRSRLTPRASQMYRQTSLQV
jgi:hypothetical protein